MSEIVKAYGGGTLKFDELNERWNAFGSDGEELGYRTSFKEATKLIDEQGAVKKVFERHEAFLEGNQWGREKPKLVTVTSYQKSDYNDCLEVWVSIPGRNKTPDRRKVPQRNLLEANELNLAISNEVGELHQQIIGLEKQIEKLKFKYQRYKIRKVPTV